MQENGTQQLEVAGQRPQKTAGAWAQLRVPVWYRVSGSVFVLLLAVTFVAMVVENPSTLYPYETLRLVICAVGGVAMAFLLMKLVSLMPKPTKAGEAVIAVVLMAALVALQVVFASVLQPAYGDSAQWSATLQYAQQFTLEGALPSQQFLLQPTEAGVYAFWCGYFWLLKLLGINNLMFGAVVLNMIAMDVAVLLTFFVARNVFGSSKALFMLGSMLLLAPLYLNMLVPGGATLVLPFVMAVVLLWQKARKVWRTGDVGKATGLYCFASALAGLGALLHLAVLFVWFAASLDLLLILRGRGRVRMLFAGIALAAAVLVGGFFGIRYSSWMPQYDAAQSMPASYWIYSGLGLGDESNAADFAEVVVLPDKASRSDFVQQGLTRRMSEMGAGGLLQHLWRKLGMIFGDGTYNAPTYLQNSESAAVARFVTPNNGWFEVLAYYSFVWQAAAVFWAVVSAIKAFLRRNDYFSFLREAVLWYVIVLLVVQAGPQSLLPVLPLLLLCALEAGPVRRVAAGQQSAVEGPAIPVPEEDFDDVIHPESKPQGSLYDNPQVAGGQRQVAQYAQAGDFFREMPQGRPQQMPPQVQQAPQRPQQMPYVQNDVMAEPRQRPVYVPQGQQQARGQQYMPQQQGAQPRGAAPQNQPLQGGHRPLPPQQQRLMPQQQGQYATHQQQGMQPRQQPRQPYYEDEFAQPQRRQQMQYSQQNVWEEPRGLPQNGPDSEPFADWMRRTPPPRDAENWERTPPPRREGTHRAPQRPLPPAGYDDDDEGYFG